MDRSSVAHVPFSRTPFMTDGRAAQSAIAAAGSPDGLAPGGRSSASSGMAAIVTNIIKEDQRQHPPFGEFHGSATELLRTTPLKIQTSGGTTGKPRATLYGA